jgi:hypothetical protein
MSSIAAGTALSAVVALACATTPPATPMATSADAPVKDQPRAVMLALPTLPDSALTLAQAALGSIEGVVQMPKVRPQLYTVANHVYRNREGGGQTQVAVIAAVDRRVRDMTAPTSLIEVSVWVLDMPHQLTAAQRRAGVPATPLTTNAPAFRQPRAMTPRDTLYWRSLEYVVDALMHYGAKRLP